jgi:hypothetical protein
MSALSVSSTSSGIAAASKAQWSVTDAIAPQTLDGVVLMRLAFDQSLDHQPSPFEPKRRSR